MAKKGDSSRVHKKKSEHKSNSHRATSEKLLVENFVSLQKVLVHLTGKFDDLSRQISELLKLFEDSAKVIVKNEMEKKKEDKGDKQLLDTMISILDQNKVIAKGLTLIYESMNDGGASSSMVPIKRVEPTEKKKIVQEEKKGYSQSRASTPTKSLFPPNM